MRDGTAVFVLEHLNDEQGGQARIDFNPVQGLLPQGTKVTEPKYTRLALVPDINS